MKIFDGNKIKLTEDILEGKINNEWKKISEMQRRNINYVKHGIWRLENIEEILEGRPGLGKKVDGGRG